MRIARFDLVAGPDDASLTKIGDAYLFWCPPCKETHQFRVMTNGATPSWTFDGNKKEPTFRNSLLRYGGNWEGAPPRCHLVLTAGRIEYCGDCSHDMAGKTIDMVSIPEDYNIGIPAEVIY